MLHALAQVAALVGVLGYTKALVGLCIVNTLVLYLRRAVFCLGNAIGKALGRLGEVGLLACQNAQRVILGMRSDEQPRAVSADDTSAPTAAIKGVNALRLVEMSHENDGHAGLI